MWDLIVSVPDHCLSFYFSLNFEVMYILTGEQAASESSSVKSYMK